MNSSSVISLRHLSKAYKVYRYPADRIKQLLLGWRKRYYSEVWALKDLSLEIGKGEVWGVIGRNGAGKSTFLRMVSGILEPTTGEVSVFGRVSTLLEVGGGFNAECTGRENVYLYGSILGMDHETMKSKMEAIEAFADIGGFIDRRVQTYSAGMLTRLAFSVAMHVDSDILLVDEVLAVGDTFFKSKCVAKFEELKAEGRTLIIVSHNMSMIRFLCTRAMVLDQGGVSYCGEVPAAVEHYFKIGSRSRSQSGLAPIALTKPEPAEDGAVVSGSSEHSGLDIVSQERPSESWKSQRYGNGKAFLKGFTLNGLEVPQIFRLKSGSNMKLDLLYGFNEEVVNPIVGIMIKTPLGLEVYGDSTWHHDLRMGCYSPMKDLRMCFDVGLKLNNGSYFLTITISERRDQKRIVYMDRCVDACLIHVSDGPLRHSGICNFDSRIEFGEVPCASP